MSNGNLIFGFGYPNRWEGQNGDFYIDKSTNSLYGPKIDDVWSLNTYSIPGISGNNGANGTDGSDGVPGPPSNFLIGDIYPPQNLGSTGYFYFQTGNNPVLFGPKGYCWGDGVNLNGNPGLPGDASHIYTGSDTPDSDLGKTGDFYFRTYFELDNEYKFLFGPKMGNNWGVGIQLSGIQGEPGYQGENGTAFYHGFNAPLNEMGIVGDFYIQVTENNSILYGPKPINNFWDRGKSLRGYDGYDGSNASYIYGTLRQSIDGNYYINNNVDNKVIYYGPYDGTWDVNAILTGIPGPSGITTLSGLNPPDNEIGSTGDYYIQEDFNEQTAQLYGPKTSEWPESIYLNGIDGYNGINATEGIMYIPDSYANQLLYYDGTEIKTTGLPFEPVNVPPLRQMESMKKIIIPHRLLLTPNNMTNPSYSFIKNPKTGIFIDTQAFPNISFSINDETTEQIYQSPNPERIAAMITESGINVGSDPKFKKNFNELNNGLDILQMIKSYTFSFIKESDDIIHHGFNAKELKDLNIPNKFVYEGLNGKLFVNYNEFIAICVSAIKELEIKVNTRSERINNLKNAINNLMKN